MNILIVGNVLKDVYLNLDERTENFETDKNGTRWLDLSFNASEHRFFSRKSNFGGAAVTLEVFKKLGLKSKISSFDFFMDDDGAKANRITEIHRYILISNHQTSYIVPTDFKITTFTAPNRPCDIIYIDRSANLDAKNVRKILSYLKSHPQTKLISYVQNLKNPHLNQLISHSNFIFYENNKIDSSLFNSEKTVLLSEKCFSYLKIKEYVANKRIDMLTHLSFYSIAAATILGSFILGNTVKDSLKFARVNVEKSKLDSTLTLNELKENSTNSTADNLSLIASNLVLPPKTILNFNSKKDILKLKNSANGIILTNKDINNNPEIVNTLINSGIIPGIKITYPENLNLEKYFNLKIYFVFYQFSLDSNSTPQQYQTLAEFVKKCQLHKIVPVLEITSNKNAQTQTSLHHLIEKLAEFDIDFSACIVKQTTYKLLSELT